MWKMCCRCLQCYRHTDSFWCWTLTLQRATITDPHCPLVLNFNPVALENILVYLMPVLCIFNVLCAIYSPPSLFVPSLQKQSGILVYIMHFTSTGPMNWDLYIRQSKPYHWPLMLMGGEEGSCPSAVFSLEALLMMKKQNGLLFFFFSK